MGEKGWRGEDGLRRGEETGEKLAVDNFCLEI